MVAPKHGPPDEQPPDSERPPGATFAAVVEADGRLRPLGDVHPGEGMIYWTTGIVQSYERGGLAEDPPPERPLRPAPPELPPLADPLADVRFEGPPDFSENFDDYRFGRKRWPEPETSTPPRKDMTDEATAEPDQPRAAA